MLNGNAYPGTAENSGSKRLQISHSRYKAQLTTKFVTTSSFPSLISSSGGRRELGAAPQCLCITELTRHVISAQVLGGGNTAHDYSNTALMLSSCGSCFVAPDS